MLWLLRFPYPTVHMSYLHPSTVLRDTEQVVRELVVVVVVGAILRVYTDMFGRRFN